MATYELGGKKYVGDNLKVRAGTVCIENIDGKRGHDACIPIGNLTESEKKRYGIK